MERAVTPARRNRYLLWGGLAALLVLGLALAFRPRPIEVDAAEVTRGPMSVTVDEEGETRIHDVYVVSAPVSGDLARVTLEPGDQVAAGETTVALLRPADPELYSVRSRAELEAAALAADAAVEAAEAQLDEAAAQRDLAAADLERLRGLRVDQTISARQLQQAELAARAAEAARGAAAAALATRRAEAQRAHAALLPTSPQKPSEAEAACCAPITAPVSGRVLRVLRESAGPILAGEPILEVGDPADLEVVADLLSTDAVRVREGAPVTIAEWGEAENLSGRVRRVEPYGFTKISALGVEEQRVNVIVDFDSPADAWARLGHGYRVETRIETWSAPDVVLLPLPALFRERSAWAAFVIRGGRARLTPVEIGHRNAAAAEVLSGLEPGERVVLHPGSKVADGVAMKAR